MESESSPSPPASIPSVSPSESSYSESLTSRVPFPNPPSPLNASSLKREELGVATAEGTKEMEGPTMELGREEKSLNGLWAVEKWSDTGGGGVGFLEFSREELARHMEETRREEEAMGEERR